MLTAVVAGAAEAEVAEVAEEERVAAVEAAGALVCGWRGHRAAISTAPTSAAATNPAVIGAARTSTSATSAYT